MKLRQLSEDTRDIFSEQLNTRQQTLLGMMPLFLARQGKLDQSEEIVNAIKNAAEPKYQQSRNVVKTGPEGKSFVSKLFGRDVAITLKGPPIETPGPAVPAESVVREAGGLPGTSGALPAAYAPQPAAPAAPEAPAAAPASKGKSASIPEIMKAIGVPDDKANEIISQFGIDGTKSYGLYAAKQLLDASGGDPTKAAQVAAAQASQPEAQPAAQPLDADVGEVGAGEGGVHQDPAAIDPDDPLAVQPAAAPETSGGQVAPQDDPLAVQPAQGQDPEILKAIRQRKEQGLPTELGDPEGPPPAPAGAPGSEPPPSREQQAAQYAQRKGYSTARTRQAIGRGRPARAEGAPQPGLAPRAPRAPGAPRQGLQASPWDRPPAQRRGGGLWGTMKRGAGKAWGDVKGMARKESADPTGMVIEFSIDSETLV